VTPQDRNKRRALIVRRWSQRHRAGKAENLHEVKANKEKNRARDCHLTKLVD
jgi:hypothetical protein